MLPIGSIFGKGNDNSNTSKNVGSGSSTGGQSEVTAPPPPPVSGQVVFIVENILKKRVRNGKTEYKVKWLGYSSLENSWEPETSFEDRACITEFERQLELKHRRLHIRNVPAPAPIPPAPPIDMDEENQENQGPAPATRRGERAPAPVPLRKIEWVYGAQKDPNSNAVLRYAVLYANAEEAEWIGRDEAHKNYPLEVVEFYERNVVNPIIPDSTMKTLRDMGMEFQD